MRTAIFVASAMTFAAPAAASEATAPSASRRTADGVPPAPNNCPTKKFWSNTICELRPMEAFSSMDLADKKATEDRAGADLPPTS
jgi:hypothetical protein